MLTRIWLYKKIFRIERNENKPALVYYNKHNSESKNNLSVITETNKKRRKTDQAISQSYDVHLCVMQSVSISDVSRVFVCIIYNQHNLLNQICSISIIIIIKRVVTWNVHHFGPQCIFVLPNKDFICADIVQVAFTLIQVACWMRCDWTSGRALWKKEQGQCPKSFVLSHSLH